MIKSLCLSYLLLAGFSSTAKASTQFNWGWEFRTEFVLNSNDNTGANSNSKPANANNELSNNLFQIGWNRLKVFGHFHDQASYYVSLDLFKGYSLDDGSSDSSQLKTGIADAQVMWKFNRQLRLDMGRIYLFPGGWEGHRFVINQYQYTQVFQALRPYWRQAGARVVWNHQNHTLMGSVTNSGYTKNQVSPMLGGVYMGHFLSGKVALNGSYFYNPKNKQAGSPSSTTANPIPDAPGLAHSSFALGIRLYPFGKHFEIEMNSAKNIVDAGATASSTTGHSLFLQYTVAPWRPFFKFETGKTVHLDVDETSTTAFTLGGEYYPLGGENFHYFALYHKRKTKYNNGVPSAGNPVSVTLGTVPKGGEVGTSQIMLGLGLRL